MINICLIFVSILKYAVTVKFLAALLPISITYIDFERTVALEKKMSPSFTEIRIYALPISQYLLLNSFYILRILSVAQKITWPNSSPCSHTQAYTGAHTNKYVSRE